MFASDGHPLKGGVSVRRIKVLVIVGVVAAFAAGGRFFQAHAAPQRGQMAAKPAGPTTFLGWPLPASGKAYGTIDGKHLWQYVREQADIAERYRDQGWGLLQVLQTMRESSVSEFARAAEAVLRQRVENSPPERKESRWLSGWLNRVNSYTKE